MTTTHRRTLGERLLCTVLVLKQLYPSPVSFSTSTRELRRDLRGKPTTDCCRVRPTLFSLCHISIKSIMRTHFGLRRSDDGVRKHDRLFSLLAPLPLTGQDSQACARVCAVLECFASSRSADRRLNFEFPHPTKCSICSSSVVTAHTRSCIRDGRGAARREISLWLCCKRSES